MCVAFGQRDEQVLDVHGAALFARQFGDVFVHLALADVDVGADHAFFHVFLGEASADLFAEGFAVESCIALCLGVEGFFADFVAFGDLRDGGVEFVFADVQPDFFFDLREQVVHDDVFEQLVLQFADGQFEVFRDVAPRGFDFLCELATGDGFVVDDEADFVNGLARTAGRVGRAVFEVLRGGLQAGDAHGEQGGDQEGFQNSCSSANGVKPWISFLSIRPERLPMLPSPFRTNSR